MPRSNSFFPDNSKQKIDFYYQQVRKKARAKQAEDALKRALQLSQNSANQSKEIVKILEIEELLKSIHFHSENTVHSEEVIHAEKAGNQLVEIIFKDDLGKSVLESVLERLFKKVTEKNAIAAYVLAQIYARKIDDVSNQKSLISILEVYDSQTRELMAINYAMKAIELGCDSAREFLTIAYSTGTKATEQRHASSEKIAIKANSKNWFHLNKFLASRGDPSSALELGCYYLGILPNGKSLSGAIAIKVPYDEAKAIEYLSQATRGYCLDVADVAIKRICALLTTKNSQYQNNPDKLWQEVFAKEISLNNELITLYTAYCLCPDEIISGISEEMVPECFKQLKIFQEKSLEKAEPYLELLKKRPAKNCDIIPTFLSYIEKNKQIQQSFKMNF